MFRLTCAHHQLRDDTVVSGQRLVGSLLFRFTDAPYQAPTAGHSATRVGGDLQKRRRLIAPVARLVSRLITEACPCQAHSRRVAAESPAQERLEAAYGRRAGRLADQSVKHGQHVGPVAGRDLDQRRVVETGACRPRSDFIRLDLASPLSVSYRAQVQLNNTTTTERIIYCYSHGRQSRE